MKFFTIINAICGIMLIAGCYPTIQKKIIKSDITNIDKHVILGNENFIDHYLPLVKNKRVGLITNPSGVNSKLQYTSDVFYQHHAINLTALFGPEHGIRGNEYGGDKIKDAVDPQTQIPLFSLYGETRKPTAEMMNKIDIMIFDIQDIGVRSYTYIYTMSRSMEACAEFNIPFIVLDRPNPLGGMHVEGNILDTTFASFVGQYPLPYIHGMTIGELAKYFNTEFNINCSLTVIPMQNWDREMNFSETGLTWIPTSPHIPEWQTTYYAAATGTLGELHTVSIGVGYTLPFKLVGTPWMDSNKFSKTLNQLNLPGIYFRPVYFKPYYHSYKGEMCQGVQLHITDYNTMKPYVAGLHIMQQIMKLYPEYDLFKNPKRVKMFNKVMGTDQIMKQLKKQISVFEIERSWQEGIENFKKIREEYLIY